MPIFTTAELAVIYEALDQMVDTYTDTIHHDDGTLNEAELAELAAERDVAKLVKDRILPHIAA